MIQFSFELLLHPNFDGTHALLFEPRTIDITNGRINEDIYVIQLSDKTFKTIINSPLETVPEAMDAARQLQDLSMLFYNMSEAQVKEVAAEIKKRAQVAARVYS